MQTKASLKAMPIPKEGCIISHIPYALKGQKLLAQGNALGFRINTAKSP
jgi:hypothetical protein